MKSQISSQKSHEQTNGFLSRAITPQQLLTRVETAHKDVVRYGGPPVRAARKVLASYVLLDPINTVSPPKNEAAALSHAFVLGAEVVQAAQSQRRRMWADVNGLFPHLMLDAVQLDARSPQPNTTKAIERVDEAAEFLGKERRKQAANRTPELTRLKLTQFSAEALKIHLEAQNFSPNRDVRRRQQFMLRHAYDGLLLDSVEEMAAAGREIPNVRQGQEGSQRGIFTEAACFAYGLLRLRGKIGSEYIRTAVFREDRHNLGTMIPRRSFDAVTANQENVTNLYQIKSKPGARPLYAPPIQVWAPNIDNPEPAIALFNSVLYGDAEERHLARGRLDAMFQMPVSSEQAA